MIVNAKEVENFYLKGDERSQRKGEPFSTIKIRRIQCQLGGTASGPFIFVVIINWHHRAGVIGFPKSS